MNTQIPSQFSDTNSLDIDQGRTENKECFQQGRTRNIKKIEVMKHLDEDLCAENLRRLNGEIEAPFKTELTQSNDFQQYIQSLSNEDLHMFNDQMAYENHYRNSNLFYADTSYTGLLNQIISSQEEMRVVIEGQVEHVSYTDLVLGKSSSNFDEEANIHMGTHQNFREETRGSINDHEQDSSFNFETNSPTNECNDDLLPTEKDVSAGSQKEIDDEVDWQQDIFKNLHVNEIGSAGSNENQGATSMENICTQNADCEGSYEATNNSAEDSRGDDLTEEQVEDFLQSEFQAASEGNNADLSSKYTPQIDQEFRSKDDAHHYFSFYGFLAGFSVVVTHVVRTTSKKRNNEIFKQEMKCHKYGKQKEKGGKGEDLEVQEDQMNDKECEKRSTNIEIKTNCPVVMVVKEINGIWKVTRLNLDHNHDLSPGDRNQLFGGHKYMTNMEKGMIRTLNATNIETRKMVAILSYLRGGVTVSPYDTKAISNFRTKINREVSGNDLMQALDFFRKKKAEDPTFFYKFDLDKEKKLKNMFWCDASCVQFYADYGDLVSFDTTFLTNRYNLPFAPFVGITGHGQTCLFGCAFLADETIDTFKWVFETFLESMGGKHPATIITDQDGAMKSAIEQVFPNTKHRNCLFHIKKKCYDKNIKCFGNKKNEGLHEEFEDIVNNCLREEEFESLWQQMITKYSLENNNYFNKMWEMRKRFIPVYFKTNFCPFLQSTARSEGTNSRFKDNIGPTYSIISFLKEYQIIVDTIISAEAFEDNKSKQKRPKELWSQYYIEKQGMELYNRRIFKKFQKEVIATSSLSYKTKEEGKVFEVYQKPNHPRKEYRERKYVVITDLDSNDFSCICCKFQKDGILYSHILKVIVEEDVSEIPNKYILDRWRKKDQKMLVHKQVGTSRAHELLRFNVLSRIAAMLTSKGSKNDATFDYLMSEFGKLDQNLDMMLYPEGKGEESSAGNISEQHNSESTADTNLSASILEIKDPDRVKRKGRPQKARRFKTIVEEAKEKMEKEAQKEARKEEMKAKRQLKNINDLSASPQGKSKKKMKKGSASNTGSKQN